MTTQHSKTDELFFFFLGTLLKELSPEKNIKVFEKLAQPGETIKCIGIMPVQGIQHFAS